MVVGSVVALTQTDVKRMLAYSSIAHAGFILTGGRHGLVDARPARCSASRVLFYLLAYGFSTIGAFAVVTLVRDAGGEATHLSQWAGLGQALAAGRRGVHAFPAGLRRHPADQRLHREVRGVPGGGRPAARAAGGRRCRAERRSPRSSTSGSIVLMFFSAPAPDGPTVAVPSPLTTVTIALGVGVTAAARRLAGPGPRPGRPSLAVRPLGADRVLRDRPPASPGGPPRPSHCLVADALRQGMAAGRGSRCATR